ncbi:MAG: TIR domain-containing protein [Gemmatimonadota bacterium]|nr:TIR domain-containing protein [Gemmatimonadota bacterium]
MPKEYDVALSFAGEDRRYADALAKRLKAGGYSVFYDEFEQVELWGKNLYDHFSSIYKDKARFCVMFLSRNYARKVWTNHERQNAQARALRESKEYILPVRIDDTEIPGILGTIGYLDLRTTAIDGVYDALVEKLSGSISDTDPNANPMPSSIQSDLVEFTLFLSEDGKTHFVPAKIAHWGSTEIQLELIPESSEQSTFLDSMRKGLNNPYLMVERFAFAFKDGAVWVRTTDVAQTTSGSQTVWKVVLEEENSERSNDLFDNVAYGSISPDDIAEMRAKRILLDEKPSQNRSDFRGIVDDGFLESLISHESRTREHGLQVQQSPFPELFRSFGKEPDKFRKIARLVAVLFLKLSNTVEDILKLELDVLDSSRLQVEFKGRRRSASDSADPPIIEVNGICPLRE